MPYISSDYQSTRIVVGEKCSIAKLLIGAKNRKKNKNDARRSLNAIIVT